MTPVRGTNYFTMGFLWRAVVDILKSSLMFQMSAPVSTKACTTVSSITVDTYLFDTLIENKLSLEKSAGGALMSLWA